MMSPLEILSLVIMAAGFATVFASKAIVKKYDLDKKQTCEHAEEMSVEEVEEYKYNKAVISLKMKGMVLSIPGLILFIICFR
ncbi:MAG TPA: hypothetical protein VIK78_03690 [Ruminiclostridium sp.]